jgi:hypothetical protein
MVAHKVANATHFNIMLKACPSSVRQQQLLRQTMGEAGVRPDAATFNTVATMLLIEGDFEGADRVVKHEMPAAGDTSQSGCVVVASPVVTSGSARHRSCGWLESYDTCDLPVGVTKILPADYTRPNTKASPHRIPCHSCVQKNPNDICDIVTSGPWYIVTCVMWDVRRMIS